VVAERFPTRLEVAGAGKLLRNWRVHGSTLHFDRNGTGWDKSHDGFTASGGWVNEVDTFALTLSPDTSTLTVTITAVGWETYDSAGKPIPIPNPNPSSAGNSVGARFLLHFVKPHLIKADLVKGNSQTNSIGNPYICGLNLAPQYSHFCGA
jgi:hypothetical protein